MTSPRCTPTLRTCMLLVAAACAGAGAGRAATQIVNSTADLVADDGQCTLREAVEAANTQAASGSTPGECAAGDVADNIVFALPAGSTIHLTGGALVVTSTVHFYGPEDATLTVVNDVSGARIFVFDGVSFWITGLTLENGEATAAYHGLDAGEGGAILAIGGASHFLSRVRFLANMALNGGAAIALHDASTGCLFQDVEFTQNEVTGGSGGGGGAILFAGDSPNGPLQIRRALFDRDEALNGAAAPENESHGGAIWIESGTAGFDLREATFDGNLATGRGGALAFGMSSANANVTATIRDCTFTGNRADQNADDSAQSGGGLYLSWNDGLTTLTNSIVAENVDSSTASHPADDVRGGTTVLASGGYNLIGNRRGASAVFPSGPPNSANDWVGTESSPLTAGVDPLSDNGGFSRTRLPILPPVPDGGSCTGVYDGDQRDWLSPTDGFRIFDLDRTSNADDACDIGAIELGLDPPSEIFSSDFEPGDTRLWSGVVGLAP